MMGSSSMSSKPDLAAVGALLAAGAGAFLASRRGRGLIGSVAAAALLAPPPGRRGWQLLGQGLSMLGHRQPGAPR